MAATLIRQCLLLVFIIVSSAISPAFAVSLKRRKTLKIIKEINRDGPYVGLITVYSPEENAFFATKAFQHDPKHPFVDFAGRRFRIGKIYREKVIYVRCGIGLINAAAATQQMVDLFDIIGVVHFGIAGNANGSLNIGDVTIPKQFVNTGLWDWLRPNGTLYSSDFAHLDIGNYNVPKGDGVSLLGRIGYMTEQFYSQAGEPNTAQPLVWLNTTRHWLDVAANLKVRI
ncbi:hypothetical protein L6164_006871 [Bauhinia variegata]|uniref:Uncharacterized protein n=1 Tax=Bauhinia variegata TaxID=167791 RepID=A0ACB9PXM4_BAUVA|nr:hypothetical protein L6164_006871 [Bauhinia variegata]